MTKLLGHPVFHFKRCSTRHSHQTCIMRDENTMHVLLYAGSGCWRGKIYEIRKKIATEQASNRLSWFSLTHRHMEGRTGEVMRIVLTLQVLRGHSMNAIVNPGLSDFATFWAVSTVLDVQRAILKLKMLLRNIFRLFGDFLIFCPLGQVSHYSLVLGKKHQNFKFNVLPFLCRCCLRHPAYNVDFA